MTKYVYIDVWKMMNNSDDCDVDYGDDGDDDDIDYDGDNDNDVHDDDVDDILNMIKL